MYQYIKLFKESSKFFSNLTRLKPFSLNDKQVVNYKKHK